ncbi:MAG: MazG family protein, partial [Pseudomonadales bacterium]|nr:MazG family protein [Pseudomonadales bacterium]
MSDQEPLNPNSDQVSGENPIERLLSIMTMLRNPKYGCPWDLEQSIASLVPFTIEEVYEVVDAIERDDMVDLEDELGDLLFQVVFYAQLASESEIFSFQDIANTVSNKLVRRHPHVFPEGKLELFGNEQALSSEQVVVNWEAIKQTEREEKKARRGAVGESSPESVLDDVPRALPALERAR